MQVYVAKEGDASIYSVLFFSNKLSERVGSMLFVIMDSYYMLHHSFSYLMNIGPAHNCDPRIKKELFILSKWKYNRK